MELRRLASSANAELPSNSSNFAFDGTNSDLAKQLYFRAKAGDKAKQFDKFDVPDTLQTRLDELKLDWYKLPGIAQRALLWDSGFGISPNNKPVKIWTLNGGSMADLAVSKRQYEDVNCTVKVCLQPDNKTSYANEKCLGGDMLKAARCVVEDFVDETGIHAAMWVTGGNPVVIPTPRVNKHAWTDQNDQKDYVVFAVHTIHLDYEPAWDFCPTPKQNDGYGSLVLPCHTTANITAEIDSLKQEVTGTHWVSQWLVEDYSSVAGASDAGKVNLLLLVPIAAGVIVVIGLIGLFVFLKRRRQAKEDQICFDESPVCPGNYYQDCRDTDFVADRDRSTAHTAEDMETTTYKGVDRTIRLKPSYSGEFGSGSNCTLNILHNSEFLVGKRLSYDSIIFKRPLSKGANGEVWQCDYQNEEVAVKRLLQHQNHHADEVEEFAQEIELSASLKHPNIVEFIGVAWSSLNNLVMALEYFPTGDLQSYLQRNGDLMSWPRDKIHIADRLDELVLDWDKLPGIAQRALLWDSGFGLTASDAPVKIWTLNKHSIADLAVPLDQFLVVGCEEKACVQPDNTTSYSNEWCGGAQMLQAARCVVEDFVDSSDIHAAMWVTGGNPLVVPTPHILKHEWKDQRDKNSYIVFAIHTLDLDDEPAWNTCPDPAQNDGYGSLVLPCFTTANITSATKTKMKEVEGSPWVSRWLVEDYATAEENEFNMVLLVPVIGGIIVTAVLLGFLFLVQRVSSAVKKAHTSLTSQQTTVLSATLNGLIRH
ncbi:hypothetical protein C6341_g16153 [Phytophthora cactorum]|nr:hypothetical protein C6341_g16153 [Phytophthora cactorum]